MEPKLLAVVRDGNGKAKAASGWSQPDFTFEVFVSVNYTTSAYAI